MDEVNIYGVKADGTRELLGTTLPSLEMKARDFVLDVYGKIGDDEDFDDPAGNALYICENLIKWMREHDLVKEAKVKLNEALQG